MAPKATAGSFAVRSHANSSRGTVKGKGKEKSGKDKGKPGKDQVSLPAGWGGAQNSNQHFAAARKAQKLAKKQQTRYAEVASLRSQAYGNINRLSNRAYNLLDQAMSVFPTSGGPSLEGVAAIHACTIAKSLYLHSCHLA